MSALDEANNDDGVDDTGDDGVDDTGARAVTLDFEDGLKGKGFVFKNPNATNTCGCGESFSV